MKEKDLVFAKLNKCPCGALLAYDSKGENYWDCSDILLEKANKEIQHTAQLPFAFYKVK